MLTDMFMCVHVCVCVCVCVCVGVWTEFIRLRQEQLARSLNMVINLLSSRYMGSRLLACQCLLHKSHFALTDVLIYFCICRLQHSKNRIFRDS